MVDQNQRIRPSGLNLGTRDWGTGCYLEGLLVDFEPEGGSPGMCTCVRLSMSLRACFSASAWHVWMCPFNYVSMSPCLYDSICSHSARLCISYVSVRVTFRRSARSTFRRSKRSTFRRSKRTPDLSRPTPRTCWGRLVEIIQRPDPHLKLRENCEKPGLLW